MEKVTTSIPVDVLAVAVAVAVAVDCDGDCDCDDDWYDDGRREREMHHLDSLPHCHLNTLTCSHHCCFQQRRADGADAEDVEAAVAHHFHRESQHHLRLLHCHHRQQQHQCGSCLASRYQKQQQQRQELQVQEREQEQEEQGDILQY